MPHAPHYDGKATLVEKLGAVLGIGVALMKAVFVLVRYPLVTDPRAQATLDNEMRRVLLRAALDWFNPAQLQWVMPASTAAYKDWIANRAKKEDTLAEVHTELIADSGAKLHWIGSKDATKVLLHFHSGGFVIPLHKGHLTLLNYFRREIKRRSKVEVKAAFLEYTLSPIAIYPTQYRQAVLAVQHILKSGISAADILICGDSAGGMLALQIISYYLHPHSSIPASPIPETPFAGILVISPWVIFDSNAPSFVNDDRDAISPAVIRAWGKLFLSGSVSDDHKNSDLREEYWREPLKAPQAWWYGTEKVTKHMMFISSEREVLRDDILSMVEQFKAGVAEGKVDIVAAEYPGGVHINSVVDAFRGRPPHDLTRTIAGWVHDRLVI